MMPALMIAAPALAYPVTVESCARSVTFDAAPERAISNDVNLTEMMLVLGLRDRMAGYTGISGWKTLDEEMRAGVAELPELSAKYPTKEVLAGAEADFFFAGWNYGMKVGGEVTPETLEPLGIKVYELTESCIHIGPKARSSMEDMYADIRNLGAIFGVSDRAEALIAEWTARLEAATAGVDRSNPLRVFVYDSGEEAPFTAGAYAMPTALIEAAGGKNILDDLEKSWAEVAWEPVIERNPEVIVIVNYGDVTAEQKIAFLKGNPAFASIDAVKNDRFVVLDYVEATPGPRNIKAVEKLVAGFAGN
ncbi:iron ABC transporter substrate-binding protein [Tabrizicola sp. TH137]|uniref:ABC transporter substrate-binding protein n=1 Tax=Tabrizicola sp. TH137 TaxID=2067452 RepID=UPI000C7A8ED3|nr:ABC transporter substrate-binding protein [Tabrizicola sp. TH137]PLL14871.1 iron ABC transporter substrate-binding protein [Tabrizicola sp. TH137]